jgi:hypothetical protein
MTGAQFPAGAKLGFLLFVTESRPGLGPTQSPVQWVPGILTPGSRLSEREADHSPPSSPEAKNA